MKLEEYEKFRNEEEQLLIPQVGPEKAREDSQAAYEARVKNIDEDIREQLRSDFDQVRGKRASMPRRYGVVLTDEDGLPAVCFMLIVYFSYRFSCSSNVN